MAPTDVTPKSPTSPRPPVTPPGSPACTPLDCPRVDLILGVETIDRFEQALVRLIRALEEVDSTNECEDAKPKATRHVAAEERKTRASKLEYKLVDEVWDDSASRYKIMKSAALPEEVTDLDEYVFIIRA